MRWGGVGWGGVRSHTDECGEVGSVSQLVIQSVSQSVSQILPVRRMLVGGRAFAS